MLPTSNIIFGVLVLMCMSGLSKAYDDCDDCDSSSSKISAMSTVRVKVSTKSLSSRDYHTRQFKFLDEDEHVEWSLDVRAVVFRQLQSKDKYLGISGDKLPISAGLILNATCSPPCEFKEARLVKLTHDSIPSFGFQKFPVSNRAKIHNWDSHYQENQHNEFDVLVCPDCSMTIELDYRKVKVIDLTRAPLEGHQTVLSSDFTSN